jgi:hypothetical protein
MMMYFVGPEVNSEQLTLAYRLLKHAVTFRNGAGGSDQ